MKLCSGKRLRILCLKLIVILGGQSFCHQLINFGANKSEIHAAEDERFSDFEIRVIRPRYFSKRKKIELGAQAIAITNQTFIYTYLFSGILTYHFSEQIGLQLSVATGWSIDKEDKTILEKDFNIKTQIIRSNSIFGGSVLWTPMYGKYQMASGRLIYFDTYLSMGAGTTGVAYKFDHCIANPEDSASLRTDYVKQYPTINGGMGQRFFVSRQSSINWDLKVHALQVDARDGACVDDPDVAESKSLFNNLTMQLGYSQFF